jgi:threonine dehydrogenase-like Zn-dependent dehydrogenase
VLAAGDGRLGLLLAQVCALKAPGRVTHFGRHPDKLSLVVGTSHILSCDAAAEQHAAQFDLVIEASGGCYLQSLHRARQQNNTD